MTYKSDALKIWLDKGTLMTSGELLLARANLGALIEGWLRLFYCIYYEDYRRNPVKRNNKMVPPNCLTLEQGKQFSRDILWPKSSEWDKWVEKAQHKRNAIHAFNHRDIGTPQEFIDDVAALSQFVDLVDSRLPYP